MKNISERYYINRPRPRHGHIMVICIKQHLSNILSSILEKISNNETDLKKNVAYEKKSCTPSKHVFFPLSLLQEVTSISELILFSTCVAACTVFIFMNYFLLNICQQLINVTSVFITLFFKCFSAIFKNITHTR